MNCTKTQGFGENRNSLYKEDRLLGHAGVDESCGYGSSVHWPIIGADRMWVYKVLNDDQPAFDGSGYWAVCAIVERSGQFFEFQIGHLSRIDVKEGDMLEPGQLVGLEGNKGHVFSGGVRITLAMQRAGNKSGSHRHYQKRPVIRLPKDVYSGSFLTAYDRTGPRKYQDKDGYWYVTPMAQYRNGFNGCVDCLDEILRFKEWFAANKNPALEGIIESTDTPATIQAKKTLMQELIDAYRKLLEALRGR